MEMSLILPAEVETKFQTKPMYTLTALSVFDFLQHLHVNLSVGTCFCVLCRILFYLVFTNTESWFFKTGLCCIFVNEQSKTASTGEMSSKFLQR